MRKILMALCLAFPLMLAAQQKVAVINTQEIMAAMPEVKAAETMIQDLAKKFDADIKSMQTELQTKAEAFQKEQKNLPEALQKRKASELEEINNRIQQSYQVMQQELAKKQEEALEPIQKKVQAAIHKVGEANGITYVLERGAMLFVGKDAVDLTDKVKDALGIKATASSTPKK